MGATGTDRIDCMEHL